MTPWVTRLILVNIVAFIATFLVPVLYPALWLVPALIPQRPWTLVTYMFLHGGFVHLLFNMIALFFFGPRLEVRLGSGHFMGLYLVSGLVGALGSLLTPYAAIVGASGAVFGVLYAFARYWPRERIYIYGILPIEARWLVVILAVMSLYGGFTGAAGGIAHFAHLGGFVGGFAYLKWMERRSAASRFKAAASQPPGQATHADLARWRRIQLEELHPLNRDEIGRLLEKVETQGVRSLSPREKELLDRFSAP